MIAFVDKRKNKSEIRRIIDNLALPEDTKLELAKMIRREPRIANSIIKFTKMEEDHARREDRIARAIKVGRQAGESARAIIAAEMYRIRSLPTAAEKIREERNLKSSLQSHVHHHYPEVEHELHDVLHGAFLNALEDMGQHHEHEEHHEDQGRGQQIWSDSVSMGSPGWLINAKGK